MGTGYEAQVPRAGPPLSPVSCFDSAAAVITFVVVHFCF